ncbi:hypothetical protein LTR47_003031 [Exophiala xenobiotica]|nr:hypothetical protein LTR47_003031 [Exophiala xenobiotica]KAK5252913.1 hypothetical protein LTS06_002625 [Exophiala xenobiotica]KAK5327394.1 hypothetical protein LTR93_002778 [Exophiala xenobiotica]KAK5353790.1 hypothetical protein LTR61_002484 [Exophiala xenobiotica]KAK5360648.1 hypothetical protein LTS13_010211 [Exophiala xenobiotica]
MFTRASNAVVKSLSWPRKRFLKWVRNDVVKAATAAENHLNLSDHNYQEPILPQVPASSQPSKAVISSLDHSNCNPVLDTLERSITSAVATTISIQRPKYGAEASVSQLLSGAGQEDLVSAIQLNWYWNHLSD